MQCSICGGLVIWKGPFVNLTHTECQRCGAINSQIADDYDDLGEDERIDDVEHGEDGNGP